MYVAVTVAEMVNERVAITVSATVMENGNGHGDGDGNSNGTGNGNGDRQVAGTSWHAEH